MRVGLPAAVAECELVLIGDFAAPDVEAGQVGGGDVDVWGGKLLVRGVDCLLGLERLKEGGGDGGGGHLHLVGAGTSIVIVIVGRQVELKA